MRLDIQARADLCRTLNVWTRSFKFNADDEEEPGHNGPSAGREK